MTDLDSYNASEKQALSKLPNRVIEAFQMEVFSAVGYPHRIQSERELWRYHDVMQELRFLRTVERRFEAGISLQEFELFKEAIEIIRKFGLSLIRPQAEKLGGGANSLIVSLYQSRIINKVKNAFFKEAKMLELGPGSGYLALLNGLQKQKQYTMDISQAFSLYQSRLFNFSSQQCYWFEPPKQIMWWEMADMEFSLPEFEVVVGNHMLAEMHNHCLRFLLAKITTAWKLREGKSFRGGLFLAESIGSQHCNNHASVVKAFADFGFGLVRIMGDFEVFYYGFEASDVQRCLEKVLNELVLEKMNVTARELLELVDTNYHEQTPDCKFWQFIKLPH